MAREWVSSEEPESATWPPRSSQMFESVRVICRNRSSNERVWKLPQVQILKGCGRRTACSILPMRETRIRGQKRIMLQWTSKRSFYKHSRLRYIYMSPWSHCWNRTCALFISHTCAPFFKEWAWITVIWCLFLTECSAPCWIKGISEIIYGPPWWQTGPDGCLNKLTRLLIFFFFFNRVCFISRTLTWGGVLLIPRSADEWRQGQTHMHVRLASIHSLSSSGGGQHQTNEGAIWLPPRQRHALPSS